LHRRDDCRPESGLGCGQSLAQRRDGGAAGRDLGAPFDGCRPHLQLTDQPVGQPPQRRVGVDMLDRQLDTTVQRRIVEPVKPIEDLTAEPDVMLVHPREHVHGAAPLRSR